MEYKFTGRTLTLADLEKAIATKNEALTNSARGSWDYFGFGREDEWKSFFTGNDGVLVMDESHDLNWAIALPDIYAFIVWLEETCEERQNEQRQVEEQMQDEQDEEGEQTQLEEAAATATE